MEPKSGREEKDSLRKYDLGIKFAVSRIEIRDIDTRRRRDRKTGEVLPYWLLTIAKPDLPYDTRSHTVKVCCFDEKLVEKVELYYPYNISGSIVFRWGQTFLNAEDILEGTRSVKDPL